MCSREVDGTKPRTFREPGTHRLDSWRLLALRLGFRKVNDALLNVTLLLTKHTTCTLPVSGDASKAIEDALDLSTSACVP